MIIPVLTSSIWSEFACKDLDTWGHGHLDSERQQERIDYRILTSNINIEHCMGNKQHGWALRFDSSFATFQGWDNTRFYSFHFLVSLFASSSVCCLEEERKK